MKAVKPNPNKVVPGQEPSEEEKERARDILDRIEIEERVGRARKTPNLLVTLTPLWAWALGLIYLPEEFPVFAKALFHASCGAGFLWFAYKTWSAVRDEKEIRSSKRAQERREQFKKSALKRKPRSSV